MTTTLRPAGPEERTADGACAQAFDIRVNGRRAGALRLAAEAPSARSAGRIEHLSVDEPDRRRGRATVAVLAAEEVLRSWGCREARASVPTAAREILLLASALGYTERSRTMVKRLARPAPELPAGSSLQTMTDAEYPAWFRGERAGYIRSWTERGMEEAQAAARADAVYAAHLPDGPASADTALRVLTHAGTDVGTLWLSLATEWLRYGADAYVLSVRVDERHRGHGHGRTLMLEAERLCSAAGAGVLGLNVFAGNTPALRLYASLGYQARELHFYKSLG